MVLSYATVRSMVELESLENVSEPAYKQLNPRQSLAYDDHLGDLKDWLGTVGKDPNEYEGYSEKITENYVRRLDQFYRWVWREYDGYTTRITHDHANKYATRLAKDEITTHTGDPYSESSKRKMKNAIEALFRWQAHERDGEEWDSPVTFRDTTHQPADEFTREERMRLREAVLEYDTIPAYSDLSPEERDRWKAYLAQRLGKPKEDVVPDDWKQVNCSWKFPSLIYVTLDVGLRPVEVERASTSWIRLEKGELHIPKDQSAKNRDEWKVTLLPETVKMLRRWLEQRENHSKYDGRSEIWLNRQGNPYNSDSLNTLLDNLCEEAGIDQTNRKIVWYSCRHSLGTHMTDKGNLAQAKEQLRHKRLETTMKYKRPSHDERRDTLNQIG